MPTTVPGPAHAAASPIHQHRFHVQRMTCGHCEQALAGAVGSLNGIVDVTVDAVGGTIDLRCTAPLELDTVAGAVYDAGYDMVR